MELANTLGDLSTMFMARGSSMLPQTELQLTISQNYLCAIWMTKTTSGTPLEL